ncbi:MAG: hypothetical protein IPN61_09390 [Bacteroidetes bacterium]|mgnify:CR=1 FL=1|nr:hypothetical protein [Bacteroidota bacterium]MBK8363034.1 hypothetical protein [Bacteroidota bacterium]MBK9413617.1 hypothetical protein [Bacteroidota bacterium]MBP6427628.1 hypothetical protein [Bacteroidia bacterium]MBP6657108.1 hypothetical protein [Bacteroidia bacterium]
MKKILFLLLTIVIFSCTEEKKYQYGIDPIDVTQGGGQKTNQKSTTEFISIAYSDLYGTVIPQTKLVNLSVAYSSFGDLKVIEKRIIANFLNDTTIQLPSTPTVNGDTILFITNTYKKFFNREPNEFEKFKWQELVRTNNSVTPMTIYFALMTSDEYRFY